jgi:hypothetical protein
MRFFVRSEENEWGDAVKTAETRKTQRAQRKDIYHREHRVHRVVLGKERHVDG